MPALHCARALWFNICYLYAPFVFAFWFIYLLVLSCTFTIHMHTFYCRSYSYVLLTTFPCYRRYFGCNHIHPIRLYYARAFATRAFGWFFICYLYAPLPYARPPPLPAHHAAAARCACRFTVPLRAGFFTARACYVYARYRAPPRQRLCVAVTMFTLYHRPLPVPRTRVRSVPLLPATRVPFVVYFAYAAAATRWCTPFTLLYRHTLRLVVCCVLPLAVPLFDVRMTLRLPRAWRSLCAAMTYLLLPPPPFLYVFHYLLPLLRLVTL